MKVRSGFVSNSSSSSFIVAFKKKPDSAEEVKMLLFGDKEIVSTYGYPLSTKKAADTVFSDIEEELSEEQIEQEASGYGPWYRNMAEFRKPGGEYDFDKCYEHNFSNGMKYIRQFLKEYEGCKFYKFEYSDEDSDFYAAMEHGGVFDKLPNIKISHH